MLKLMTLQDACVELRVSRRTIYRMVASRLLPKPLKFKNHRQVYFYRADFDRDAKKNLGRS